MNKQIIVVALSATKRALHELDIEVKAHQENVGTVSTLEQLRAFRSQLTVMQDELFTGKVSGLHAGLGRVIVDSWFWDTPLGEVLLDAEQKYLAARA